MEFAGGSFPSSAMLYSSRGRVQIVSVPNHEFVFEFFIRSNHRIKDQKSRTRRASKEVSVL